MKRLLKFVGIGLGLALVALQFIPGNLPEVSASAPNDLLQTEAVEPAIADILKTSCYSCHSTQTQYPWYSFVAPASFFVAKHVREGREELNFSEWATQPDRRKLKMLEAVKEEVEEGEMPLKSYTLVHRSASLTEAEKQQLIDWCETLGNKILGE